MTVALYRAAVDFYIRVALCEWSTLAGLSPLKRVPAIEKLTHAVKARPEPPYDIVREDRRMYKMPSYLRRAAIMEALGSASSYMTRLEQWEAKDHNKRGLPPGLPGSGMAFPAMYRGNSYERTGMYTAKLKVFHQNTWTWLNVELRKSDADYITRHCASRKECVPVLRRKGKRWALAFSFEEKVRLNDTPVKEQRILAVDLGINNACACSVMTSDGTILHRDILTLDRENNSLRHALNKVKQAQQRGNHRTPRLWAAARGVNDRIAVITANHITELAKEYSVSCVVMEYLEAGGRKKGSYKQRLHHWKSRYVQQMVENKCHRLGIRISRVNAWNTSRLAFDGSGRVERGTYLQDGVQKYNYSVCVFPTGKTYHCDLNASYNIGARYFIREILKSCTETRRSGIEAKVPQCAARSTCTLSTLISLHAVLAA